MNNPDELLARIKYLKDVERLSFRQIALQTGVGRERCCAIYLGKSASVPARVPQLERYRQLISEWYAKYPTLLAAQVHERLKAQGVSISYQSVTHFTREFRAKRPKCYFALTFDAAEEAQVDWFVVAHPLLGQLAGFAMILSHSRFLFARIFPRMSFEFFIEGHLCALNVLGGITRALRYDNLKSVVLKRQPLTYNAAFLEFAHYYGFEIRLCNVRAGNEKGRVERAIRTIRESFLNTASQHQSLRALNAALAEWLVDRNQKPHRTTGKAPVALKQQEQLKALPLRPWLNRCVHPPKLPTKTGLIIFDTNQYSVPEYLVGQALQVHAFCDKIEIYDGKGSNVATHPRSFERNKTFLNPLHRTLTRVSAKTKTERIFTVMKRIDAVVERFLALNQDTGEDPLQTAHLLFQLLSSNPRAALLSAIREALVRNTPRASFVISLLNSQPSTYHETVNPNNKRLLTVDYKPRPLEEYGS